MLVGRGIGGKGYSQKAEDSVFDCSEYKYGAVCETWCRELSWCGSEGIGRGDNHDGGFEVTEQHECFFEPMLAECECGRSLTIGELCKRANAVERLSALDAAYLYAQCAMAKIKPERVLDALRDYVNELGE